MDLLIGSEYSFLAGCLEEKPKYSLPWSFTSITAFRIIWIHLNWCSSGRERAIAVFGSNKTAEILEQSNYVISLVNRVWYESPAYPVSNTPTLEEIHLEMNEKWTWQSDTSKLLSFNYF
jgi:hypothetical protein